MEVGRSCGIDEAVIRHSRCKRCAFGIHIAQPFVTERLDVVPIRRDRSKANLDAFNGFLKGAKSFLHLFELHACAPPTSAGSTVDAPCSTLAAVGKRTR